MVGWRMACLIVVDLIGGPESVVAGLIKVLPVIMGGRTVERVVIYVHG